MKEYTLFVWIAIISCLTVMVNAESINIDSSFIQNNPYWTYNIISKDDVFNIRNVSIIDGGADSLTVKYFLEFNDSSIKSDLKSNNLFFKLEGVETKDDYSAPTVIKNLYLDKNDKTGWSITSKDLEDNWNTMKYYQQNMNQTFIVLNNATSFLISFGQGTTILNFTYENNYTLQNNTVRDIFIYDSTVEETNITPINPIVSNYYHFDGYRDDIWISSANSGALNNGKYSLTGWARARDLTISSTKQLMRLYNGTYNYLSIDATDRNLSYIIESDTSTKTVICPNAVSNVTNTWYFFGLSWNGEVLRTFCNGISMANTTGINYNKSSFSGVVISSWASGTPNWDGDIDEVALYDTNLSEEDFSVLYSRGVSGLSNNITTSRIGYFNGEGLANQDCHWRTGLMEIANVNCRVQDGYVRGNSYYTTNDWRTQNGSSWYTAGEVSQVGRYAEFVNYNGGIKYQPGSDGDPVFDLRNGGTLSAWIYKTQYHNSPTQYWIIYHSNSSDLPDNSYSFGMDITPTTNLLNCYFKSVNGTESGARIVSISDITNYAWHNVVCTFDGVDRKMFIDGVEVNVSSLSFTNAGLLPYQLSIGNGYGAAHGRAFQGYLDEIKIYNKSLSEDEILSDYNRGLAHLQTNITSGLLLYYPFNDWCFAENTANCYKDASGNNRHGSWYNTQGSEGIISRGSQAEFPDVAICVVTSQGISIFNSSGDFWMGIRASSTSNGLGRNPTSCTINNGVLCAGSDDGVHCLDFKNDGSHRWITGSVDSGYEIVRSSLAYSFTGSEGTTLPVGSSLGIESLSLNDANYVMQCTNTSISIINLTGKTTYDDTVTDGLGVCHLGDDGVLVYKDASTLALEPNLPNADFTPDYTVGVLGLNDISSNGSRVFVGLETGLFSYNYTLGDLQNHSSLLAGGTNVTKVQVLDDLLYASTNPDGFINEIYLDNLSLLNSWSTDFSSQNFTELAVWHNDSSTIDYLIQYYGEYDSCDTRGLIGTAFYEGTASMLSWEGFACTSYTSYTMSVLSPVNNTLSVDFTVTSNISIGSVNASSYPVNCTLYIDGVANQSVQLSGSGEFSYDSVDLVSGVHDWYVYCSDGITTWTSDVYTFYKVESNSNFVDLFLGFLVLLFGFFMTNKRYPVFYALLVCSIGLYFSYSEVVDTLFSILLVLAGFLYFIMSFIKQYYHKV